MNAIDTVIRRKNSSFITVWIKAIFKDVVTGDAVLFTTIPHEQRDNYWFVFYSERMDIAWIMIFEKFLEGSVHNKTEKNKDKCSIWFNSRKADRETEEVTGHCKPYFEKYVAKDFTRLK